MATHSTRRLAVVVSAFWLAACGAIEAPAPSRAVRQRGARVAWRAAGAEARSDARGIGEVGEAACATARVLAPRGGGLDAGLARRLEVGAIFGLWYALNVYYNVVNKRVLKKAGLPWLVASAQLGVGALYSCVVWASGLRAGPADLGAAVRAALPIAVAHGAGQAATVVSLGAGAVSSTHVIKALEPLFSAGVNALVNGEVLPLGVYASLLPVVGGVGAAVATDLSFNPLSFASAMASNLCFAFRAVCSKNAMRASKSALDGLGAPSLFGVVTLGATLLVTPRAGKG